jgi:hypothetical protein
VHQLETLQILQLSFTIGKLQFSREELTLQPGFQGLNLSFPWVMHDEVFHKPTNWSNFLLYLGHVKFGQGTTHKYQIQSCKICFCVAAHYFFAV